MGPRPSRLHLVVALDLHLVRSLLGKSYRGLSLTELGSSFVSRHAEPFPAIAILVFIGLVLHVINAGCERGFSLQNQIKTKLRNCLLKVGVGAPRDFLWRDRIPQNSTMTEPCSTGRMAKLGASWANGHERASGIYRIVENIFF